MSSANHDSIKDGTLLFPLCLCDHIPLASFREVWSLRYTAHRGPKSNVFQKVKVLSKFLQIVPKFSLVHEIGIIFLEGEVTIA